MHVSALPPAARAGIAVLRSGLETGPAVRRIGVPEPDLLGWLAFTGLGSAYRKACLAAGAPPHSRPFLDALDALRHGALARNMVHFAAFARVHAACSEKGIGILPLKGLPAVVRIHGGDLSMRPMADLDLLVRPGEEDRLLGVLSSLGYVEGEQPIGPFLGGRSRHLPARVHPRSGSMVEVHLGADYDFHAMGRRRMPDFFAGAVPASVDGRDVLLPGWPAWLFQWAVHLAYADAYLGKMRDLYDAAVLLARRGGEVPWGEIADPRRTAYLLRPLASGLRLVEDLFGAAPPEPWRTRLAELGGQPYPLREFPEWLARVNLSGLGLFRRVPLSALAALSLGFHLPGSLPRLAGEFLRIFLFPPIADLERQYGGRRGPLGTPLLYSRRALHFAGLLANRVAGKFRS
jgi:hypothetical protein